MISMSFSKSIRPSMVIHIFAVLHAVVALVCRLSGVGDELFLTILTMAMSLIICYQKELDIDFTAAVIIAANIIGYLIGTVGANVLESFLDSPMAVHAVSTAMTTEILGWSIVAITRIFRQGIRKENALTSSSMRWILLAAGGIFAIRLCIVMVFSREHLENDYILNMTGRVLSNTMGIIFLVCMNTLYVRYIARRGRFLTKWKKSLVFSGFTVLAVMVETGIVALGLPMEVKFPAEGSLTLLLIVSFMTQITIYCVIYIINYAFTSRYEMQRQREKAHLAQYRYLKLKRQVNPHFLFNSLNILDCLVCEEKTEQASTYIHKLAGIYRYMIKSEDEELVLLRDELVFVNLYVDLLRVRFPEGFDVEVDVDEESMGRYVLPCSIQLLIENATKHNSVTSDEPLVIKVKADGVVISVSNNVIPKVTTVSSTGLGHKYIRQQYLDISGKEIEIRRSDGTYCVTLPLL